VPFSDQMADGATVRGRASRPFATAVTDLPRISRGTKITDRAATAAPILVMSRSASIALALTAGMSLPRDTGGGASPDSSIHDLPLRRRATILKGRSTTRVLALVQMVTPVTPPERLALCARDAQGLRVRGTMTDHRE